MVDVWGSKHYVLPPIYYTKEKAEQGVKYKVRIEGGLKRKA